MATPTEIREALSRPFPANDIEWRVQRMLNGDQSAMVVAYITSRAVMDRLDEVVSIDGWQDEYREFRDKGVECRLSLCIDGEWLTKSDAADETQVEGTKGGRSDALKRAAVKWGIGRYLYNLDTTFVELATKKSDCGDPIYAGYSKTRKSSLYFDRPALPKWVLPGGTGKPPTMKGQQSRSQPSSSKSKPKTENTDVNQKAVFASINAYAKERNVDPALLAKSAQTLLRESYGVESCADLSASDWANIRKSTDRLNQLALEQLQQSGNFSEEDVQ